MLSQLPSWLWLGASPVVAAVLFPNSPQDAEHKAEGCLLESHLHTSLPMRPVPGRTASLVLWCWPERSYILPLLSSPASREYHLSSSKPPCSKLCLQLGQSQIQAVRRHDHGKR